MNFELGREFALKMDENDPLNSYRSKFLIPKQENGQDFIYLCGNSLGLQPKRVKSLINLELEMWEKHGVEGHFKGTNWQSYHEKISEMCSTLVGGQKNEVVLMNTLTVNLHLMMISFYKPTPSRFKIMVEHSPFPSDRYAIVSQIKLHGFHPEESLIELKPRKNENIIFTDDILDLINQEGNQIALILIGGVNYLSGQVYEMEKITKIGHKNGCIVGFDLAHAFANVELNLHEWQVDFAVWCTYKYGNGGPGSIAGCFVHEMHHNRKISPRLAGWWGHDKESRFMMGSEFIPIKGVEGWQISNPPIFSMTPLIASFEIFNEVGMERIIQKSKLLTNYLEYLINSLKTDKIFVTPKDEQMRGCQISIHVKIGGKLLYDKLKHSGVICDWREPDVIRIAPIPLYNSFLDVYEFVGILKQSISIL